MVLGTCFDCCTVFLTCIETSLYDPPITPEMARGSSSGTGFDPSGQMKPGWCTFVREALTNSSDCSSAYVSLEQVSSIWAPSFTPGRMRLSWLISSSANNMASSLWIPRSSFILPQSSVPSPFSCTGNKPPITRSPSMMISRLDPARGGVYLGLVWARGIKRKMNMGVTPAMTGFMRGEEL